MKPRQYAIIAGVSYLIIFFTAIYANFFVLEALTQNPTETVTNNAQHIRFGVMAFLLAAVFDVVVAWGLNELYKQHVFTSLSTYFRVLHAGIMGVAVFALLNTLTLTEAEDITAQVNLFNTIWLIGLFFFGAHLILLSRIVQKISIIPYFLLAAGVMYMVDTGVHFLLPNYQAYADTFLLLVAIPAIAGEMAFSIWLLRYGGKRPV